MKAQEIRQFILSQYEPKNQIMPTTGTPEIGRKQSLIRDVLGRPTEDIRSLYSLGRELGRGQFGITYLCVDKATGEQLACKTISKRKLCSIQDVEDVRREVAIMHHMAGHPNIVQLKGAYEDKLNVHIVMDLCAGGELFDRIVARRHYSEKQAAKLIREIVQVVQNCHALGVMHRDLKPENFLLANTKEDSPLKATDFGMSVFFKPGEEFSDIVGSAYYIAPEVLRRKYGCQADVWSCGVILYILIAGVPPFWAENEAGIFDAILLGKLDFKSDPWPSISTSAKDLVRKMLKQDPKARITASEVLDHPWIKPNGSASDKPLQSTVVSKLKQFAAMNKMKKLALRIIATSLSEKEIVGLNKIFQSLDTDNSGSITFEELKSGLVKHGNKMSEVQIRQLLDGADVDQDGTIDYSEFITATMHLNKAEREEHLYDAFQHFDKDFSGHITKDELKSAMSVHGDFPPGEIDEIMKQVDLNEDGKIDYSEFSAMMRTGNLALESSSRSNLRDIFNFPTGPPKMRK